MNIKQLNEELEKLLNENLGKEIYLKIATEVRSDKYSGSVGFVDWSLNIDIVGQEGMDGSITQLTEALRNKSLSEIADCIESGNLKDIIELELTPNNIRDKLSAEATLKDCPNLIKKDGSTYYWTIRFDVDVAEMDY